MSDNTGAKWSFSDLKGLFHGRAASAPPSEQTRREWDRKQRALVAMPSSDPRALTCDRCGTARGTLLCISREPRRYSCQRCMRRAES